MLVHYRNTLAHLLTICLFVVSDRKRRAFLQPFRHLIYRKICGEKVEGSILFWDVKPLQGLWKYYRKDEQSLHQLDFFLIDSRQTFVTL